MKPKEWLKKHGHIDTIGRGRLSAAHIALIKDAVSNGAVIEGYAVSGKPSDDSADEKTVSRVSVDPNRIADVPDPLRNKNEWTLIRSDTKKPIHAVGMCNVCQGCGNSFTYCPCSVPTFLDNTGVVPVEFKVKKGGV